MSEEERKGFKGMERELPLSPFLYFNRLKGKGRGGGLKGAIQFYAYINEYNILHIYVLGPPDFKNNIFSQ